MSPSASVGSSVSGLGRRWTASDRHPDGCLSVRIISVRVLAAPVDGGSDRTAARGIASFVIEADPNAAALYLSLGA